MNISTLRNLAIGLLSLYISECYAQSCPHFTREDGIFTRHLTDRGHNHQKIHFDNRWWHIVEQDALFDLEESLADVLLPDLYIGEARPRYLDDVQYCIYPVRRDGKSLYFAIMPEEDFERYEGNTAHYLKWLRHHHHKHWRMDSSKEAARERFHLEGEKRRAHEVERRRIAFEERLARLRERDRERYRSHKDRPAKREGEIIFKG